IRHHERAAGHEPLVPVRPAAQHEREHRELVRPQRRPQRLGLLPRRHGPDLAPERELDVPDRDARRALAAPAGPAGRALRLRAAVLSPRSVRRETPLPVPQATQASRVSRLGAAFAGRTSSTGLIPFLTAGYPSLGGSLVLLLAADPRGVPGARG